MPCTGPSRRIVEPKGFKIIRDCQDIYVVAGKRRQPQPWLLNREERSRPESPLRLARLPSELSNVEDEDVPPAELDDAGVAPPDD
jgi:hypothetical protein